MRGGCKAIACVLLSGWVVLVGWGGGGRLAQAVDAVVEVPPPGSPGWEPLAFRSVDRHTSYSPVRVDGRLAYRAQSECSASALAVPVEAATLERTPVLRWSWKVERPLEIADERVRDGDDFAARVYLLFRFEPEGAGWFERSRRALGERIYGRELPGNALNYVWSSREERGEAWANPHSELAQMVSLGPGAPKTWREEEVDVVADYQRTFGGEPPELLGLAIMTDSDNTCTAALAEFSGFRFVARSDARVTAEEPAP